MKWVSCHWIHSHLTSRDDNVWRTKMAQCTTPPPPHLVSGLCPWVCVSQLVKIIATTRHKAQAWHKWEQLSQPYRVLCLGIAQMGMKEPAGIKGREGNQTAQNHRVNPWLHQSPPPNALMATMGLYCQLQESMRKAFPGTMHSLLSQSTSCLC